MNLPFTKTEVPEWKTGNPDPKPTQTKIDTGFVAGEKPAASMWNWFANRVGRALVDLYDNAIHKDQKAAANGVASLDAATKIPNAQLPSATTSAQGAVVLSTSVSSTSTTTAATPSAVKSANDLANGKYTKPGAGIPKTDLDASTQAALTPYVASTGTANAYVATFSPAIAALTDGLTVRVKINVDNTGIATVNVNGLGAKAIKKSNGNDVGAGNLKTGSIYTFAYNGTAFILQGEGGEYGTATAGDVVAGETIGTDAGVIAGTLSLTGNAAAGNVLSGQTFYSTDPKTKVTGNMPNNGTVAITPGTTSQTIPAGYHNGSGSVAGDADLVTSNIKAGANIFGVVGAANVVDTTEVVRPAASSSMLLSEVAFVNGSKVTGTMPNRGATNITPGTTNQVIPAGYHNGAGIVTGDADLIAANIKAGANIFGVAGATNVIDTTEATLPIAAADVLSGEVGFVNGAKITGTMPNNGAGGTVTPGTTNQTKAAGYYSSSITITGDADLVTGNIKAGANIFGVAGKTSVVDTADATAIAADILAGDTAYVNGVKVTGTAAGVITTTQQTDIITSTNTNLGS